LASQGIAPPAPVGADPEFYAKPKGSGAPEADPASGGSPWTREVSALPPVAPAYMPQPVSAPAPPIVRAAQQQGGSKTVLVVIGAVVLLAAGVGVGFAAGLFKGSTQEKAPEGPVKLGAPAAKPDAASSTPTAATSDASAAPTTSETAAQPSARPTTTTLVSPTTPPTAVPPTAVPPRPPVTVRPPPTPPKFDPSGI